MHPRGVLTVHHSLGIDIGLVKGCIRCRSVLPQGSGQMCASCAQLAADELHMYDISRSGTVWRECAWPDLKSRMLILMQVDQSNESGMRDGEMEARR